MLYISLHSTVYDFSSVRLGGRSRNSARSHVIHATGGRSEFRPYSSEVGGRHGGAEGKHGASFDVVDSRLDVGLPMPPDEMADQEDEAEDEESSQDGGQGCRQGKRRCTDAQSTWRRGRNFIVVRSESTRLASCEWVSIRQHWILFHNVGNNVMASKKSSMIWMLSSTLVPENYKIQVSLSIDIIFLHSLSKLFKTVCQDIQFWYRNERSMKLYTNMKHITRSFNMWYEAGSYVTSNISCRNWELYFYH